MSTFQERFKGKTTVMGRNGLESVLNSCQQPIKKDFEYQNRIPQIQQPLQQQVNVQPVLTQIQYNQQQYHQPLYQHNPYIPEQQIQDSLQYLSQQQYFQPTYDYQVRQTVTEPQKKMEQRSQSAKQQQQQVGDSQRYKPYTIKDYEIMKKTANAKLGGLGPNISGDEWAKEKEKVQKRQEFAEQVRQFNSTNIITIKSKETKQPEINARQKAMEFARNIPKPVAKKKEDAPMKVMSNKPVSNMNQDPFDDEIARLEREHLKYLNQLDKMK
ncbi:unnamed protein product (macronuclear) [Paramecium tetraurelia]|uniref:Uncharacterized protein n=1 Tax=Paramecium tetraurelia TaxID=5888 RepID=A0C8J4_PARTE|nr:uncharacterized protein GSPATT00036245001 [Paramecium tetraurelia]CAK67111.1 unnamed protein product [Paramecium tetraurelia]|eukprot:XP_001434508.1 hypothetical protein (macronuclear) [Paramecium tetraurelia strain d4-2]